MLHAFAGAASFHVSSQALHMAFKLILDAFCAML
jgi:hypothetical protein